MNLASQDGGSIFWDAHFVPWHIIGAQWARHEPMTCLPQVLIQPRDSSAGDQAQNPEEPTKQKSGWMWYEE